MNKEFLYSLLNSNSVSGSEVEIEKKIYDHMLPIADSVSVDEMGTVTAAVNPDAPFRVLMTGLSGLPIEETARIPWVSNASVTRLCLEDGHYTIDYADRHDHLGALTTVLPANV